MKVTLISYTPEPEKVIAAAAKLCYSKADIGTLMNDLTDEKVDSFLERLNSMGHESPIEHVSFTFGIEGISRACSHQLVRHRIASYSQKSQRYVSEGSFEYIVPPEIERIPEAKAEFISQMKTIEDGYNKLAGLLIEKHTQEFVDSGMDEKTARSKASKKAYEDARFVLPNACETKIVMTMNARSLMNFFRLRCCNRAQWEIKAVADEMLKLCYKAAPTLFKNAGPTCVSAGKCTEGKMTCGKYAEVAEFYKNLKP
ncbi:MAG: FAD-dependent thymidylate synthase [Oscillospiraceae bacterium]